MDRKAEEVVKYPVAAVKVTFMVFVKRFNPVIVYTVPAREQLEPVSDPEQVAFGVKSVGTVMVSLRSVGLGAFIVKGEVILMLRVEVPSKMRVFVGVYVLLRTAAVMATETVPCST